MKQLLKYCLFVVLLFALPVARGQEDKQAKLETQRQAVLAEIKQINALLFRTKGQKKSVLTEVEALGRRIAARENLIRITNRQANLFTRKINGNRAKIEARRSELKLLKDDYAAMVKKSYKSKSQQNRVMFLLSSSNFLQAYKRMQYMKQYTRYRKKQGEQIQQKTEDLKNLNSKLTVQKKEKEKLIAENNVEKNNLSKEKNTQQALVTSLKRDEGKFVEQIRKKQREADRLDKAIDRLIRAAIAKSNSANTAKAGTFALNAEAKVLAANFTSNKGKLPWPLAAGGVVIKSYGAQRHPQLPNVTTFNSGVEIATVKGTQARAVFNGQVLEVQQLKGANKAVYVRHGNYITIYSNLADVRVKKGDGVTTKDRLGTIFTNPLTGKTVLKFLVYQNNRRLNPADWIFKM
ncbi:MAG: murein hydrolase activator EnvC family protein [Marinirhabdus sp.]